MVATQNVRSTGNGNVVNAVTCADKRTYLRSKIKMRNVYEVY